MAQALQCSVPESLPALVDDCPDDECRQQIPLYRKTDLLARIVDADQKCKLRVDTQSSEMSARFGSSSNTSNAIPDDLLDELDAIFSYKDLVKVQAPMVRCSRPPFRKLCRLWGTDISYTHMIVSECFVRSQEARDADFALYLGESRLVTQLAGHDGPIIGEAARLVAPFCDAVDINCGCPQKWAMKEGFGAALLEKPELVADMIRSIRNAVGAAQLPCVVKMRVYDDERRSVEFARQVVAAGASWVTIHGRTPWDTPSSIVRTNTISLIRDHLTVPVVANGSVESPRTAMGLSLATACGSVMCGRGLLSNPSAFYQPSGEEVLTYPLSQNVSTNWSEYAPTNPASSMLASHVPHRQSQPATLSSMSSSKLSSCAMCPAEVIADFVRLADECNLPLRATQHHLLLMANDYLSPCERMYVSQQRSTAALQQTFRHLGLLDGEAKRTAVAQAKATDSLQ